jgi:hypothetical protein
MKQMYRSSALILAAMLAGGRVASAESLNCGAPPQLPVQSQEEEKIKWDLEGRAKFLSALIGGGDLKVRSKQNIAQSINPLTRYKLRGNLHILVIFSVRR